MYRPQIVLALAIALALPDGARATVVSGSFAGIIDGNVYDTYGLFGAPGTNLSGEVLTATYRYDTGAAFSYMVQPTYDAYLGTGNLALSVTIGGVTVSPAAMTGSQVVDAQDGLVTAVSLSTLAPTPLLEFSLVAQGAWQPGVTIETAFTLSHGTVRQAIYVSGNGSNYDVLNFSAIPVPAPGSLGQIGAALVALWWVRRGRRGVSAAQ